MKWYDSSGDGRMLNVVRNKTVVITGGGTGLGKALAIECAFQKADVVIVGRRKELLHSVIEEINKIKKKTGRISAIQGDISTLNGCEKVVTTIKRSFGGVDVLINNAAVFFGGSPNELKPGDIKRMLDTNLTGHVLITSMLLDELIDAKRSGLINILSIAAKVGIPYMSIYSAAKFGMTGFSQSLRREHGAKFHILDVYPEALKTGLTGEANRKLEKVGFSPLSTETAAKEIIEAFKNGREELYMGKVSKSWRWKNALMPGSVSKQIAKIKSTLNSAFSGVNSEQDKTFDSKFSG
jgi:short-subunit dehydrogenase